MWIRNNRRSPSLSSDGQLSLSLSLFWRPAQPLPLSLLTASSASPSLSSDCQLSLSLSLFLRPAQPLPLSLLTASSASHSLSSDGQLSLSLPLFPVAPSLLYLFCSLSTLAPVLSLLCACTKSIKYIITTPTPVVLSCLVFPPCVVCKTPPLQTQVSILCRYTYVQISLSQGASTNRLILTGIFSQMAVLILIGIFS